MNWSNGGDFTKNLLSLQLQLQTLMEGVGGDSTASLLDGLAKLTESERAVVIPLITRAIHNISGQENRLMSEKDKHLKDFEDSLFNGVIAALNKPREESRQDSERAPKLSVVSGGIDKERATSFKKPVRVPGLIDLAKARESRRTRSDNFPPDLA